MSAAHFALRPEESTTQALARLGFGRADCPGRCSAWCSGRRIVRLADGVKVPESCEWSVFAANAWIAAGCRMEVACG